MKGYRCAKCDRKIDVHQKRIAKNPNRVCMACHKKRRKGWYVHAEGYIVVITVPGRNGRRELEHRVVAEKMIGRKLHPGEVVHHKNHDRTDNRPENLEVVRSTGVHIRDHHPEIDLGKAWRGKKQSPETSKKKSATMKRIWSERRKINAEFGRKREEP